MKINTQRSIKPKIKTPYFAVAGIIVIAAAVLAIKLGWPHKSVSLQTAQDNSKKSAVIDSGGNPTGDDNKGASTGQYTPPSNSEGISLDISQSSGNVVVSTKLAGYSDGTCELKATNGAKSSTQSAQVIYAPNFSTCAGFSIPESQLGPGNWSFLLDVTAGGITTSKTATFEVN